MVSLVVLIGLVIAVVSALTMIFFAIKNVGKREEKADNVQAGIDSVKETIKFKNNHANDNINEIREILKKDFQRD